MSTPTPHHRVVIVGAGLSGVGLLYRLRRSTVADVVVLEAADRPGGTWRDNVYPGCQCDVPSNLYSLSFAPNPAWSTTFPRQPEIQSYIERVTVEHGLDESIRFGCRVEGARWDEAAAVWSLDTTLGPLTADALVLAVGFLSEPEIPPIAGLDLFDGQVRHTARWSPSPDLHRRCVAVIGTGASAVQLVPELAPLAKRLVVYQRTPPWVLPHVSRRVSAWERRAFERLPRVQRLRRELTYVLGEVRRPMFTRPGWQNRAARAAAWLNIRIAVRDRDLAARLTPDYDFGCKRALLSNTYYRALNRPNVELVDRAVQAATATGLVDADGVERAADVIVFATGFRVTRRSAYATVTGLDGRRLDQTIDTGGAYLGTVVHGFPNLFVLGGPATGATYTSFLYMLESQQQYVTRALCTMEERRWPTVDVRRDVQARYDRDLQARSQRMVWASGCTNWFVDEAGRNHAVWPGSSWSFRRRTRRFDAGAYVVDERGSQTAGPVPVRESARAR